jgi:UDP-N-acetylmuramoyl-tripeptide--D-alanyl-D-alanine ligase
VRLTVAEIAAATGGTVLSGDPGLGVDGVGVDSRTLVPGALFVALRAERDGHDFLGDAFERGAGAALVSRQDGLPALPAGAALVAVADTAAALTALGRRARERLEGVPVVGITGSTGKTSTKDLTNAALSANLAVCASPGSFNNEFGLPLTLLSATEAVEVIVAEMGARGTGQVAALAEVARPTIGVITNIGIAHAEFFGSRAEVAQAKGELLEALPAGGTAVLNADDDMTPGLAGRSPARVLTAGLGPSADIRVSGITLDDDLRPSFRLETPWGATDVSGLPLRGAHQAGNAAFAVAVAVVLGVGLDAAVAGLARAAGSLWRMELCRTPAGLLVLNDAYNANPTSMAAALEALCALDLSGGHPRTPGGAGQRYAVLGHMAELGPRSDDEHRRLGRLAAACGLAALVAVGPEVGPLAESAREGGVDVIVVDGPEGAVEALAARLQAGDAVLVKASRVAGLERLATALEALPLQ